MCRVSTTGTLYAPKLCKVKLCLMRRTDHKNSTIMLLYCQPAVLAFFHLSYNQQERGTLDTTGTVSFIAVIFQAIHKFWRANFTKWDELITRWYSERTEEALACTFTYEMLNVEERCPCIIKLFAYSYYDMKMFSTSGHSLSTNMVHFQGRRGQKYCWFISIQ